MIKQCENGHLYDTDEYSTCPYCSVKIKFDEDKFVRVDSVDVDCAENILNKTVCFKGIAVE